MTARHLKSAPKHVLKTALRVARAPLTADLSSTATPRAKKQIGKASRSTVASASGNGERHHEWAPFVSVAFLIVALFSVVLCKMELRRVGYSVLKLNREERSMRDEQREQMIQLARMTRPERLQAVAQSRLTLKKAEAGQIIQMTQQGVAFRQ